MADLPVLEVYRAPLRSRRDDVDPEAAVSWALERGVVAVGGVLDHPPSSREEAVDLVRDQHDERMADRLDRFIAVEISSFVWTRSDELGFRLGRVHGPWAYDSSTEAAEVDLPHTRACRWAGVEIAPERLPADVALTFDRGGRNFQRIRSEAAERATLDLWERL